jgi:hypothetical protein
VVANDGAASATNSFLLTVSAVNDEPSFTLSTNLVLLAEDAGFVTNASFLTALSAGPTNEASQKWTFTVKAGTNFAFATAPAISTNGTLTFRTATNAVGTNLITVVMKDTGGTTSGGKDSVTNTFSIGVSPVNDAPYFAGLASKTILEDAVTNNTAVVNVIDTDTLNTGVAVTATSSDTNLVTVAITATNSIGTTNAGLTLTFSPLTNANGSVTITLVANDGTASATNSFLLTVSAVNDQPSFTLSTNLVLLAEDAGFVTNSSFLTALSAGPTNESNQKWTFTVTSGTNFGYLLKPAISTNGTLVFKTATNAIGTNLITVVMKDTGGTTGGGRDSVTNTFSIGVSAANDAPYFTGITSRTVLEDATTNNTATINVIDTDTVNTSVAVTATSGDTNLVAVALTATNSIGTTNSALTLRFSPVTNAFGSTTITVVANDGSLSTTNSFLLTVSGVNDRPAFAVSTNLVLVSEDAGGVTNASFLTGLSAGPGNETNQTWTFTVTAGTNFNFTVKPALSTNGTLTFQTATNAIGTNLITVVMKDTGGTTGGGINSATNTFSIGVTPVNDAPYFTGIAAKTILEDAATGLTATVNVIDTDTVNTGVAVTATSSDTNLATVAITATNSIGTTNSALTLTFSPLTNAFGSHDHPGRDRWFAQHNQQLRSYRLAGERSAFLHRQHQPRAAGGGCWFCYQRQLPDRAQRRSDQRSQPEVDLHGQGGHELRLRHCAGNQHQWDADLPGGYQCGWHKHNHGGHERYRRHDRRRARFRDQHLQHRHDAGERRGLLRGPQVQDDSGGCADQHRGGDGD